MSELDEIRSAHRRDDARAEFALYLVLVVAAALVVVVYYLVRAL